MISEAESHEELECSDENSVSSGDTVSERLTDFEASQATNLQIKAQGSAVSFTLAPQDSSTKSKRTPTSKF